MTTSPRCCNAKGGVGTPVSVSHFVATSSGVTWGTTFMMTCCITLDIAKAVKVEVKGS